MTTTETGTITVALVGNPNTGKSTVFNALTGLRQHVGNWTGKTVEKAEGWAKDPLGARIRIVDLPGTYALHSESVEEQIACEYLLSGQADVVIAIVDVTNLARNLYLVLQLLELTDRLVVALNFMDEAEAKGIEVDADKLRGLLGVPVVRMVAVRGEGVTEALSEAVRIAAEKSRRSVYTPRYGPLVETCVQRLLPLIRLSGNSPHPSVSRWIALRVLEGDPLVTSQWLSATDGLTETVLECQREAEAWGTSLDLEIARALHQQASSLAQQVINQKKPLQRDWTQLLDSVLTHKWLAFPLMLSLFGFIFWLTAIAANKPSAWLETAVSWLVGTARTFADHLGLPWWLKGSLIDGILLGLGSVLAVMFPPMLIFFVLYALLEDFGLVPRVAFNLDRLMQAVGSQGKHCLSCMVSYGCNIPGVLAARVIEDPRVRLLAIITSPLNPCNGRWGNLLPLSFLLFGRYAPLVLVSLIVISFGAVLLVTWILSKTILKGQAPIFVLELPPFRRPSLRKILVHTVIGRAVVTQYRALLVAAPFCALIWLFSNLPVGAPFSQTVTGQLVGALSAIGRPFGLDGSMLTACLFALPAKEIALASLAITYGLQRNLEEPTAIFGFLKSHWSFLDSFTFLVFYTLYLPCAYTFVVQARESGHWKWAVVSGLATLLCALFLTFLVHHSGRALMTLAGL
ncbi:MAG: ferrous iron transport protein B [Armatimonadetes bacterium]|nr:ferrous iron transport protein B [Armatimonadota bacterium]MDW8121490.1 ferrous iron transport protein B [Armatimonadota bacterium]